MYESHWALQCRPFENRHDSSFYYPSESHQAALLKLHYAIETQRSVALLCGDAGVGKTMLLDSCIAQLPDSITPILRVVYPAMPPEQLIRYVARQVAPQEAFDSHMDIGQTIETIERVLQHNASDGHHTLLIIDEAHLLDSYGSLEPLRLLLNLASEHASGESALTLCLCGSNTLIAHVARHSALEDRVAVRCVLDRLSLEQTSAYINHRLRIAGRNDCMFDTQAIETIQQFTSGIPRRINRLCDLALMIGFAQDLQTIDVGTIESASSELSTRAIAA